MATPITDFLGEDHERLVAHLERARRDGARFDEAAYDAFRAGLYRHLALEEKILIPAVRRAAPGDVSRLFLPVEIEHAAIAALLLGTPDGPLADEIASLLAAHERAETGPHGVYAVADILLIARVPLILDAMRAYPMRPPPRYVDGPNAVRTARAALAAAAETRLS